MEIDLEEMKADITINPHVVYSMGRIPEEMWVYALSLNPHLWKDPPLLGDRRLWSQEFLKTLVPENLALAQYVEDLDDATAFAAVKFDPQILRHLEDRHRENKALVLSVVWREGSVLRHSRLRDNKEVVLVAVHSDGDALKYASSELRQDKEVCMAAMRSINTDLKTITYVQGDLRYDKEVACAFLSQPLGFCAGALKNLDVMCGLTEYVKRVDTDYENLVLVNLGQKQVMRRWSARALETGDRRPAYGSIYGQGLAAAVRFNARIMEFLLPGRLLFEEAITTRVKLLVVAAEEAERVAFRARAEKQRAEERELSRRRLKYARFY